MVYAPVDEEPEVTLSAGVTKNKSDVESQKLRQLLAGMEKIAGDNSIPAFKSSGYTLYKKEIHATEWYLPYVVAKLQNTFR